jgi:predicted dithiol-disulfide oxidoreductase (DUF899 family)/predicted enzyme related to lactoylglutathione lyase
VAQSSGEHGNFYWNELVTCDVEKAKKFYSATIGWTFDAMPMPDGTYWVAKMGDKAVGGLFPIGGPQWEGVPEHWMSYLAVDDVDARVKKATAAGAKLMRPNFDVPGVGRIAILTEPGGSGIGWITPAAKIVVSGETVMKHNIVSQDQWLAARKALLAKEKEFTKARDALSAERRQLPWVKLDKSYVFEGPEGKETVADLFGGRSQLIVYHFMLGPGWAQGCPSCSYLADHFDGANIHLAQRDVTLVVVSRAPYAEIAAYQNRMGWKFKRVSSYGGDFNHDFHVSFTPEQRAGGKVEYNYGLGEFPSEEAPGLSTFIRNEGGIFHAYSTYARGLDILIGAYNFLDMAPKGRDEDGLAWSMAWVRHHDRYDGAVVDP